MTALPVTEPLRRVVIADDAAMIRVLLRQILEGSMAFHVVGEAGDGEEAVRLVAEQQPDLIVLDLAMPILDGLQAIPRIRRLSPATRIAVLSGFNADRMAVRALEEGADAYLEKRDRPDELLARLLKVCHTPAGSGGAPEDTLSRSPEEMARRSRERFRLAFEHAPIGIALESLDGRLVMVNDALCRITGHSRDELTDAPADSMSHPDDVPAARSQRDSLLAGRASFASREHRYLRPDGRPIWTNVSRSLLRDELGAPLEFVTQVVDISEQKRAEAQQRVDDAATERYAQELARSNAELAHFASVAAHELRSPLQVITGFASLLGRMYGPVLDDRGRESVDWIVKSAARMDALIEDLLAYTRVGPSERVDTPVDLGAVMEDVVVALEGTVAKASVTWDALPAVTGDPVQLNQLLLNLVSNGCKFVPSGATPRVHVSAVRKADGWCVTVADNGIGIEPEGREQIFEMFKRLNRREAFDGTGIGLAICKRIVEGRGGRIWVEDGPEGGSCFRFTIPDRTGPGPDRTGLDRAGPDRAEAAVHEDGLLLRLARDLRYATLTGDRVSVFCVRLDALPGAAGVEDVMREVEFRLKRAIRPHDAVERTGETQFAVVCTSMSSPQDIVTVRSRLSKAAANAGAAVFIGVASSSGDDEPEDLLRRAVYGSNR